jgi:hypothetical protein
VEIIAVEPHANGSPIVENIVVLISCIEISCIETSQNRSVADKADAQVFGRSNRQRAKSYIVPAIRNNSGALSITASPLRTG